MRSNECTNIETKWLIRLRGLLLALAMKTTFCLYWSLKIMIYQSWSTSFYVDVWKCVLQRNTIGLFFFLFLFFLTQSEFEDDSKTIVFKVIFLTCSFLICVIETIKTSWCTVGVSRLMIFRGRPVQGQKVRIRSGQKPFLSLWTPWRGYFFFSYSLVFEAFASTRELRQKYCVLAVFFSHDWVIYKGKLSWQKITSKFPRMPPSYST